MLLRLLCLLPIFVFCTFRTLAQTFEPGLLVRSNGDTLRGEVENAYWDETPSFVRYRPTSESASVVFKPRQLRVVYFTGGRLFRYQAVSIDHAAETRTNRLARGYRPQVRIDSLLAEVLIDGTATLLRVMRPGSTHYIVQAPGQPALELSERKYYTQAANGNWAIANGNNYRGQLGFYFGSCAEAFAMAQTAPFTAEGIAGVVQAYNEKCGPAREAGRSWVSEAKVKRLFAWQGGLIAGGTSIYYKTDQKCLDCMIHPFAGLYTELLLPNRRFAIYGELSVASYRGEGLKYVDSINVNRFSYRVGLGTLRLGIRHFITIPHEQQLILGFDLDLNKVVLGGFQSKAGPPTTYALSEFSYGPFAALPSLGVGWRSRRFTLGVDGQVFMGNGDYLKTIVSSNFSARLRLAYRLSRHPDVAPSSTQAKP